MKNTILKGQAVILVRKVIRLVSSDCTSFKMAPPPEYDKEPKAPDKSASNIPCEDPKVLYNLVNEHQTNSDTKSTYTTANAEVEVS